MLHIVLCDDDPAIISRYKELLAQLAEKHRMEYKLSCFGNAEQLLFALDDIQFGVDILYLDVQMDRLNGIEAAKKLRSSGCRAQIIFLTNAREYVFESFDVSPLQYLLKGDTSIEKRIDYDVYYIENWTLALDIRILIMTAFCMFNKEKVARPAAKPGADDLAKK